MTSHEAKMPEAVCWQYRYRHELPNGGKCEWHPAEKSLVAQFESEYPSAYETRGLYTADQMRAMYLAGLEAAIRSLHSDIDEDEGDQYARGFNDFRYRIFSSLTALVKEAQK